MVATSIACDRGCSSVSLSGDDLRKISTDIWESSHSANAAIIGVDYGKIWKCVYLPSFIAVSWCFVLQITWFFGFGSGCMAVLVASLPPDMVPIAGRRPVCNVSLLYYLAPFIDLYSYQPELCKC